MSKISDFFRNTFLGEPAKAEPTDEAKTEESKDDTQKEQSEELKEADQAEDAEASKDAQPDESKDEAQKEQPEEPKEPEADKAEEPSKDASVAGKAKEDSKPDKADAEPKEFDVEEHLDDFFWYLKAHPIYTRMLLNSSEALGAKPVPVFFNRFTDPQHRRMLLKKDIKETVKKHFGGDLEKACAENGGWFDREYRVADAKGNPGEIMPKTPSPEDTPGDGPSGGDSSAA